MLTLTENMTILIIRELEVKLFELLEYLIYVFAYENIFMYTYHVLNYNKLFNDNFLCYYFYSNHIINNFWVEKALMNA